jgi:hypothetical protein
MQPRQYCRASMRLAMITEHSADVSTILRKGKAASVNFGIGIRGLNTFILSISPYLYLILYDCAHSRHLPCLRVLYGSAWRKLKSIRLCLASGPVPSRPFNSRHCATRDHNLRNARYRYRERGQKSGEYS